MQGGDVRSGSAHRTEEEGPGCCRPALEESARLIQTWTLGLSLLIWLGLFFLPLGPYLFDEPHDILDRA